MPGCRGAQCIQAPILVPSGLGLSGAWTEGCHAAPWDYAAVWLCGFACGAGRSTIQSVSPERRRGLLSVSPGWMEHLGQVRLRLEASMHKERTEIRDLGVFGAQCALMP